jgi:hypothetical protein
MHGHAREHDHPTDDSNPTDMSNMTCYGCGEKGHITKDLKCKNFGKSKPSVKMFVAQEILDEDDDGRAEMKSSTKIRNQEIMMKMIRLHGTNTTVMSWVPNIAQKEKRLNSTNSMMVIGTM